MMLCNRFDFFSLFNYESRLFVFFTFFGMCEYLCSLSLFYMFVLVSLLFTPYFYLSICYLLWWIYDWNALQTGGHVKMWYRRLSLWRFWANYFPVKLYKTADLDPEKNYVMGYHPHGITSLGCFINFASDATNASKLFPGINIFVLSLNMHNYLPIHRDQCAMMGICQVKRESLEWVISKNGKGNVAVIVVGGAEEALGTIPNTMHLNLKDKKGFIKIALKHGASLLPCISFGENEIYKVHTFGENSIQRKIQLKLTKILSFSLPICHGRFAHVPYGRPINTIVGKAIDVEKNENPSQDEIDKLHALYVKSLCDLFYAHRKQFADDPNMEIVIN